MFTYRKDSEQIFERRRRRGRGTPRNTAANRAVVLDRDGQHAAGAHRQLDHGLSAHGYTLYVREDQRYVPDDSSEYQEIGGFWYVCNSYSDVFIYQIRY